MGKIDTQSELDQAEVGDQNPAQTGAPEQQLPRQKSLSAIIGHFVLDQGPGILKFLKNGQSYEPFYNEFLEEHPKLKGQISLKEFEDRVIESVKRTLDAIVAEIAAIPGSALGAFTASHILLTKEIGPFAFTGSIFAIL